MQTQSLKRLVGPMRKRRAGTGILRIGIRCRSKQERCSATGNTTGCHQTREEDMPCCDRKLRNPAALRPARSDSDYC